MRWGVELRCGAEGTMNSLTWVFCITAIWPVKEYAGANISADKWPGDPPKLIRV